ncbi:MAG: class I poly(R)-hydroxyalkanoic acid synthase [Zoogloeaceae bacterium]|jgi:polyhydroxyalkanoate synthase|nr:class I poly(R)-hydroxyalkanoic acid synthase [Zoogloeaceae bacterium]
MSNDTKNPGGAEDNQQAQDAQNMFFQQFFRAGQAMAQGFASFMQQVPQQVQSMQQMQMPPLPTMPQMPQLPDISEILPPSLQYPKETAEALKALQDELVLNQAKLWQATLAKSVGQSTDFSIQADPSDRRFSAPEWGSSPIFDFLRQSYLLNSKYLFDVMEVLPVEDERAKEKLRFAARQYTDALSPANYAATNPEVIKLAVETQGRSITAGINNLIRDMEKGRISMTDESVFEVGKNLAVTEGQVIYENPLFQLIQYAPLTDKVAKRPILFVPPCINKFYILDLQPDNSLVRYLVEQGFTVFLVSWKNPGKEESALTWDEYLEKGVINAIHLTQGIAKRDDLNLVGFCVGGTLLSSALAVLAGRGEKPAASLTLLTTMLDFSDTGEISLFIDEQFLAAKEASIGKGGLMQAMELQNTFSMLRPNDLVWNYVASNYLKGQKPQAFDILYWNSDSTNLPGPFACWYMRNMYHNNSLRIPGKLEMCGVRVDLGQLDMPVYLLASREDHIVPWYTAYQSTRLLSGEKRFVLGASGHIAGVINPASKNKRSYWTNEDLKADAQNWLAASTENKGSWWSDWAAWIKQFADGEKPASKTLGDSKHRPIEPAPGRYVKERVV